MGATANTFSGLFFLRNRPSRVLLPAPAGGSVLAVYMPLMERVGSGERGVLERGALWRGTEATAWCDHYADRLKAGCALHLVLERLQVERGEVTGNVVHCELAPERWPSVADSAAAPLDAHNQAAAS